MCDTDSRTRLAGCCSNDSLKNAWALHFFDLLEQKKNLNAYTELIWKMTEQQRFQGAFILNSSTLMQLKNMKPLPRQIKLSQGNELTDPSLQQFIFHSELEAVHFTDYSTTFGGSLPKTPPEALLNCTSLKCLVFNTSLKYGMEVFLCRAPMSRSLRSLHLYNMNYTARLWNSFRKALQSNDVLLELTVWCSNTKGTTFLTQLEVDLDYFKFDFSIEPLKDLRILAHRLSKQQLKLRKTIFAMPSVKVDKCGYHRQAYCYFVSALEKYSSVPKGDMLPNRRCFRSTETQEYVASIVKRYQTQW